MRLIKIVPPLLALLIMGLVGWRLSLYVALRHRAFQGREFAQAHPLLQWLGPSQSATQDEFTLLAIQNVNMNYGDDYDDNGSHRTSWSGKMLVEMAPGIG